MKSIFKRIFLSIRRQKKDTFVLLSIFFLITSTCIFFVIYNNLSSLFVYRIQSEIEASIEIKSSLNNDNIYKVNDDDYKDYLEYYLSTIDEINRDYYYGTPVLSADLILTNGMDNKLGIYAYEKDFDNNYIINGNKISEDNEILIKRKTIISTDGTLKEAEIGDILYLKNSRGNIISFKIVGTYEKRDDVNDLFNEHNLYPENSTDVIMTRNSILENCFKSDNLTISDGFLICRGSNNLKNLIHELNSKLVSFETKDETISFMTNIDDSMIKNLSMPIINMQKLYRIVSIIMLTIMAILCFFGLINIFKNRQKEFGIWKSLGLSSVTIVCSFIIEVLIIMTISFIFATLFSRIMIDLSLTALNDINLSSQLSIANLASHNSYINYDNIYQIQYYAKDFMIIFILNTIIISIISMIIFIYLKILSPNKLLRKR